MPQHRLSFPAVNGTPTILWVAFTFYLIIVQWLMMKPLTNHQLPPPTTLELPIALGNYLGLLNHHRFAF